MDVYAGARIAISRTAFALTTEDATALLQTLDYLDRCGARIVTLADDPDIIVRSETDPDDDPTPDRLHIRRSAIRQPESAFPRDPNFMQLFQSRILKRRLSNTPQPKKDIPNLPPRVWDALLNCYTRCFRGEEPPPGTGGTLAERLYRFYRADPVIRAHWGIDRLPNAKSFQRYYNPFVRRAYLEGKLPYYVHGHIEDDVFDRLFDDVHMPLLQSL